VGQSCCFLPAGVRLSLRAGASSAFVAGILRRLPLPSLIYHRDDFDDAAFQRVLQSKALDRASELLLMELADEILSPLAAPPAQDLAVLCIGSTLDRLVPYRTVEGFARRFTRARVVAAEKAWGHPCGHVGYFFKAGVREPVFREVVEFLRATVSVY
jgi:alpha-beta hydrolase superfamily lysophospholipase